MTGTEARDQLREVERLIELAEGWRDLPTGTALSVRIARHLSELRAERVRILRALIEALDDAG